MDDEGTIEYEATLSPRLHDRWSLLTLGVAFVGDVVQTTADYPSSAAMMAAQHSRQKEFDKKFKEITWERP
jgi:hypothetical protein